jgi:HD-like signal output (HDOD) protein
MSDAIPDAVSRALPGSSRADEYTRERRAKQIQALLQRGLPTLPQYLLDLNALLSSPSVELKRVSKVVRTDPSLSAQLLRLCNSPLFGLRRRVLSVEQATVLVGTERLRAMVLTCSVMEWAGDSVPRASLLDFWKHSFLAALLSERIARAAEYPETEQSYLCGLTHDIGQLPMWMLVREESKRQKPLPPEDWPDNLVLERDYFATDHTRVGRWLASSWNFMPSFFEVFEHHHDPENAKHDPYIVGIVAAADQFLQSRGALATKKDQESNLVEPPEVIDEDPPFLQRCLPLLSSASRRGIFVMLQTEYSQLLPLVELGLGAVNPASGPDQTSQEHSREEIKGVNRR